MSIQRVIPGLDKSLKVGFEILVLIMILAGCGGGGGGGSQPSSDTNQALTATISSPTGTDFREGQNIVFSGSGTDSKGDPLGDNAFTWTSSIDGTIGTGSTLITSALSAGSHKITLTANDSDGKTYTTDPLSLQIEATRCIKMGSQTTGVPDASNAFDGDPDTAATIMTADTEFIHFKAQIGGADTFLFKIKVGASSAGSTLAVEGLAAADGTWQTVDSIDLSADQTVAVKVTDAQLYKDAAGYINLRVLWKNGQAGDNVPIYEIWRIDPVYAGPKTTPGITHPDNAFDGNASSFAALPPIQVSNISQYLQFKAYVGVGLADSFSFSIMTNNLGMFDQLVIQVQSPTTNDWNPVQALTLNTTDARTVTVSSVQNDVDADGYVSLRAYWVPLIPHGSGTTADIYEITRIDPVTVGPKTTGVIEFPAGTFAQIDYFWGEEGHHDFVQFQSYVGDANQFNFSIQTEASEPGSNLIIEGEQESGDWSSPIVSISLDAAATTTVTIPNAQQFVNADGMISLRARWEGTSPSYDARIDAITRLPN
jgi:hypothetical protein